MKNILITGGAGFIGSHVVRRFVGQYADYHIVNLDALTYAGNLENLADVEGRANYTFVRGDICDAEFVGQLMRRYEIDAVIHLAAESHVDRSIADPLAFARTNVLGTLTLLQAAREWWENDRRADRASAQRADRASAQRSDDRMGDRGGNSAGDGGGDSAGDRSGGLVGQRGGESAGDGGGNSAGDRDAKWAGRLFYHVSTDEVYGTLDAAAVPFTETTRYDPHSPYSASKASSDHFVRAFHDTYGMPVVISNCSNNYGPYQFPEKLIPLFINNIRHGKPLPVYGDGGNVRDWLYVEDHARAIDTVFHRGRVGQTYNIGGLNEWRNIDLVRLMVATTDRLLGRPEGASDGLITFVKDRAGHDLRYAIDASKLRDELGWTPSLQFEQGLELTVSWYLDNQKWLDNVTGGEYQTYYEKMYGKNRK